MTALHRTAAVLAAAFVVLVVANSCVAKRSTLYVFNGLSAPVTVRFGDRPPLTVESGHHPTIELPQGRTTVEVRQNDRVISSEEIVMPSGSDFVAYNVLGAAPLYKLRVHYSAHPSEDAKPDVEALAGPTLVSIPLVDAVFEELPKSIETQRQSGEEIRVQVAVAGDGRWPTAATMLLMLERNEQAARMLRQVLKLEDEALDLALHAIQRSEGSSALLELLQQLVRERPDWYQAHRALQWELRCTQGVQAARAIYRARAAEHPDSSFEQLLLARVDEKTAAEASLRKLLSAAPDDARIARCLAVVLERSERWSEAASLLERTPKDDPDARAYLSLRLAALMGAGRDQEALEFAEASLDSQPDTEQLTLAALVAGAVASLNRAAALIDQHSKGVPDVAVVRALAGIDSTGTEKSRAAKIIRAAATGPADAWKAMSAGDEKEVALLGDQLLLLLAAEFHRMGDVARADALYANARPPIPAAGSYAYVERGEEGEDIAHAEPRLRAALYLARALALESSGADGARLRARAEKADLPHGFISRAVAVWPKGVAPRNQNEEDKPITFTRVTVPEGKRPRGAPEAIQAERP